MWKKNVVTVDNLLDAVLLRQVDCAYWSQDMSWELFLFCFVVSYTHSEKLVRCRMYRTSCSSNCVIQFPLSSAAAAVCVTSPVSRHFAGKGWLVRLASCFFFLIFFVVRVLTLLITGYQTKHKQKRATDTSFCGCSLGSVRLVCVALKSEEKQLAKAKVCYFYPISSCEQTTSDASQVTYRP